MKNHTSIPHINNRTIPNQTYHDRTHPADSDSLIHRLGTLLRQATETGEVLTPQMLEALISKDNETPTNTSLIRQFHISSLPSSFDTVSAKPPTDGVNTAGLRANPGRLRLLRAIDGISPKSIHLLDQVLEHLLRSETDSKLSTEEFIEQSELTAPPGLDTAR